MENSSNVEKTIASASDEIIQEYLSLERNKIKNQLDIGIENQNNGFSVTKVSKITNEGDTSENITATNKYGTTIECITMDIEEMMQNKNDTLFCKQIKNSIAFLCIF